jgi:hypothetical protein
MKQRNFGKLQKSRIVSKKVDTAVVPGFCLGLVPQIPIPVRAFERSVWKNWNERRANETTLPMYPVTNQMEISSFHLDYEPVR